MPTHKWTDLLAALPPDRQQRIEAKAAALREEEQKRIALREKRRVKAKKPAAKAVS